MIESSGSAICEQIGGSFRDPSGFVFWRDGQIYRAIDQNCHDTLRQLHHEGLLQELIDRGTIVATQFVEDARLADELATQHAPYQHFLQHETLSAITYPYEWSFSMLADAALLTLSLQISLLENGYSLKDATAYNVQFVDARPVFIDIASIERPPRQDLWYALGMFMKMFLFPLTLCHYHGWDLRSYFLSSISGRDAAAVLNSIPPSQRWRPRNLLDITLPAWLARREEKRLHQREPSQNRPADSSTAQTINLRRLQRKITKLKSNYRVEGHWKSYPQTCTYTDRAIEAKKRWVREFLSAARPRRVLDLGCNTGEYSRIAGECGAQVLAVDSDHDTIELFYRNLQKTPAAITPMVLDLNNPSPAIGFLNRERDSFLNRAEADCVLGLALLHHLITSNGNIPLDYICELLHKLSGTYLILEFVPPQDPMFEQLMKFRTDSYLTVTLESCKRVFAKRFDLLSERPIPDSQRHLLFLRSK